VCRAGLPDGSLRRAGDPRGAATPTALTRATWQRDPADVTTTPPQR
jgi:hypothetical protein